MAIDGSLLQYCTSAFEAMPMNLPCRSDYIHVPRLKLFPFIASIAVAL